MSELTTKPSREILERRRENTQNQARYAQRTRVRRMAPDDRELYAQYKKHYDAAHRARKKITRNEADLLRFKGERQILDDAIKDLTHTIKCEYGTIKRNTDKALALKAALDAKTTQAPESEPADASDLEDQ